MSLSHEYIDRPLQIAITLPSEHQNGQDLRGPAQEALDEALETNEWERHGIHAFVLPAKDYLTDRRTMAESDAFMIFNATPGPTPLSTKNYVAKTCANLAEDASNISGRRRQEGEYFASLLSHEFPSTPLVTTTKLTKFGFIALGGDLSPAKIRNIITQS